MNLANPFATVFLGTLVNFVIDALAAILAHPRIFAVQIVVVMEILIAASLDHAILVQVVASFVLTILQAMSVSCVSWDILEMPLIRIVISVIVMLMVHLPQSVTVIVANAHAWVE